MSSIKKQKAATPAYHDVSDERFYVERMVIQGLTSNIVDNESLVASSCCVRCSPSICVLKVIFLLFWRVYPAGPQNYFPKPGMEKILRRNAINAEKEWHFSAQSVSLVASDPSLVDDGDSF